MRHPAWFPDWRQDAFNQLQAKNDGLEEQFDLGSWERWDYDLATASLTFSHEGRPKVIADIQIAGTTSKAAGNWLWAWANPDWPRELIEDSLQARSFGDEHGICDLTHDYVDAEGLSLNGIGWELTAAAARVSNALGAYRPPRDEGGGLYLLIRRIGWAS
jgi:hypothetical protein